MIHIGLAKHVNGMRDKRHDMSDISHVKNIFTRYVYDKTDMYRVCIPKKTKKKKKT